MAGETVAHHNNDEVKNDDMRNEPTYMDCWHYVAPLLPVTTDFGKEVYVMIFRALKDAEEKRVAGKKKEAKHET